MKSIERELMNQLQENQLAKKAIILYFDSSYCEQAIVTIKSLCAHQRGLRIYVFNKGDIPQEWFSALQWWLPLDDTYNFFVGYDVYDKSEYRLSRTRLVDNQLPLVLYWNSLARPYGYCIGNEGASPSFSSD